ncbi:MAG: hypothetical protein R3C01_05835 [Planctomycetaceae bacterium]
MDVTKLQTAYRDNEEVAAICDEMSGRQNNQAETKLKSFLSLLNRDRETPIKRWKIIAAFRLLEEVGCGRYVEGRHGHPSRFAWNPEYKSLAIARAALGEALVTVDQTEELVEGELSVEGDDSLLEHYFNLRADYQLELSLPIDLTISEAERLAAFIRSLPLEDYQ